MIVEMIIQRISATGWFKIGGWGAPCRKTGVGGTVREILWGSSVREEPDLDKS